MTGGKGSDFLMEESEGFSSTEKLLLGRGGREKWALKVAKEPSPQTLEGKGKRLRPAGEG